MEIRDLQKRCYNQAIEKGWGSELSEIPIPEQVAHLHAEVSEAFESYRRNEPILWKTTDWKPEGVSAEYVDVIVRICHYATLLGVDLEDILEAKLKYNLTRPYRHGDKRT